MKKIDVRTLKESAISLFDDRWCLITAGRKYDYNTMTASWGAMGELWNKDVCFVFIRPQRYTYEFMEREDFFTLSFFPEQYKDALKFCGSKSGRKYDKAKETGLTPVEIDGCTSFGESNLVILCKKIAYQDIDPKGFLDSRIKLSCYPMKDYHRMYIGEIIDCYVEE